MGTHATPRAHTLLLSEPRSRHPPARSPEGRRGEEDLRPALRLAKPKEVHQTEEEHLSSDVTHPRLQCPCSGPRVWEPSPVCRPDHREVRALPDTQAQARQAAGPLPNGQADSGQARRGAMPTGCRAGWA